MIIGHTSIIHFLAQAQRDKKLGQVYCFAGPSKVGKRAVAKSIAAGLLATPVDRLEHHPDYTYIERLEDEKTGKLKKELSVAQARELRGRLERRSWLGGYHVVIINEAEALNEESSNALLKTLEEPAFTTVIFLITDNDEALLPTIRSRAQMISFSLVPDTVLAQGLLDRGIDATLIETIIPLASGRPGMAIAFAADESLRTTYYTELQRFRSMLQQPFYVKTAAIESLFKEKEDGERQRERLQSMLDIWLIGWRVLLLERLGIAGNSSMVTQALLGVHMSTEAILSCMSKVIEAKALLRYNVNQRLVIETCILSF